MKPPTREPHFERPGPAEFKDLLIRREIQAGEIQKAARSTMLKGTSRRRS